MDAKMKKRMKKMPMQPQNGGMKKKMPMHTSQMDKMMGKKKPKRRR